MDTLAARVAANVRAAAGFRGVTQTDLARALGTNQSTISHRYRGKQEWSLSELDAVARFLRVRLEDLLLPRLDSNQQPSD